MVTIDNDKITAKEVASEQVNASQSARVGMLFVGDCGLNLGISTTTTDGEWKSIIDAEVPVGVSENVFMQLIARGPNKSSMAITYNALMSSDPDELTLTPEDPMNDGKRINKGDSLEWALRVVIAPEITPDSNPPTRNIKAQVRGENGKTIRWGIFENLALSIEGE